MDFTLWTYSGVDNATCIPPSGKMNYTVGQDSTWQVLVIDQEFIQENNCYDPCKGQTLQDPYYYEPIPTNIFRSADDVQTFTMNELIYIDGDKLQKKSQQRNRSFFLFYVQYGLCLLPYILLQGIWAASFGRRSPREVRDLIYAWLHRCQIPYFTSNWAKKRDVHKYSRARRIQRSLAWFEALTVYLWALFVTLICAPLLVANVIASEIFLNQVPQSESATHIGAWAPWAATGLVLFAAGVARFQNDIIKNIKKILTEAKSRPLHWPHMMARRWKGRETKGAADSEKGNDYSRKMSTGPYPGVVRQTGWKAIGTLGGPVTRFRDRTGIVLNMLYKELFYFVQFCKNPDDPKDFVPRWKTNHYEKWKIMQSPTGGTPSALTTQDSYHSINLSNHPQLNNKPKLATFAPTATADEVPRQPPPTRDRNDSSQGLHIGFTARGSTIYKPIRKEPAPPLPTHHARNLSRHLSLQKDLPLPPPITPEWQPTPAASIHRRPNSAPENEESHSLLAPEEDKADQAGELIRSSSGLTYSLEHSMLGRQRRSQAYFPDAGLSPHSTSPPAPQPQQSRPHHPPAAATGPVPTVAAPPPSAPSAPPVANPAPTEPSRYEPYDPSSSLSPRTDFRISTPKPLISEPEMQQLLADAPPVPPIPANTSSSSSFPIVGAADLPAGVERVDSTGTALEVPARHQGRKSTVSYLQVARPATMLFGDEIRLRKDEWGTYHVVDERGGRMAGEGEEVAGRGRAGEGGGGGGSGRDGGERGMSWFDGGDGGEWRGD